MMVPKMPVSQDVMVSFLIFFCPGIVCIIHAFFFIIPNVIVYSLIIFNVKIVNIFLNVDFEQIIKISYELIIILTIHKLQITPLYLNPNFMSC